MKNPFDGWTKEQQTTGTWAVDKDGKRVAPISPEACKWCAQGVLHREQVHHDLIVRFNKFLLAHENFCVVPLNDFKDWGPARFRQAWDECFGQKST